jgi:hypothetical protein
MIIADMHNSGDYRVYKSNNINDLYDIIDPLLAVEALIFLLDQFAEKAHLDVFAIHSNASERS